MRCRIDAWEMEEADLHSARRWILQALGRGRANCKTPANHMTECVASARHPGISASQVDQV